jgi:DNA-binding response OmpR family regulator
VTSILVVEDEPSLRRDLVDYLGARGFVAAGVGTVADLRTAMARRQPDILILDVGLPDGNGFAVARDLRRSFAGGIIMLTALGTPDDRVAGLESGADVYLVKHASLREIEATLRSLLRRLVPPVAAGEPATALPGAWHLDARQWRLTSPAGVALALTGTEVAFMAALFAKAGKACPREEIALALGRPADRALDAVVRRLRRKIEAELMVEAPIRVVYGEGYAFAAPIRPST